MSCKVIHYKAPATRIVNGTTIAKGQNLYAIQDVRSGLLFIWSYLNKDYAERIAKRVKPSDKFEITYNWRKTIRELTPSDRIAD